MDNEETNMNYKCLECGQEENLSLEKYKSKKYRCKNCGGRLITSLSYKEIVNDILRRPSININEVDIWID